MDSGNPNGLRTHCHRTTVMKITQQRVLITGGSSGIGLPGGIDILVNNVKAGNREDPGALARRFSALKPRFAQAVRDHSAL